MLIVLKNVIKLFFIGSKHLISRPTPKPCINVSESSTDKIGNLHLHIASIIYADKYEHASFIWKICSLHKFLLYIFHKQMTQTKGRPVLLHRTLKIIFLLEKVGIQIQVFKI